MVSPIRSPATVWALSTITPDTLLKPLPVLGCMRTRNSGESRSSPVADSTVTDGWASKRSCSPLVMADQSEAEGQVTLHRNFSYE